jgi:hypothetical protein
MTLLGDWNWYLPGFLQPRTRRPLAGDVPQLSTDEGS